jgi:phosphoribosylformimino-5-aminoimidazole carboxamide ribotide isomerase
MLAIPAIDLREGRCVQLVGGSYDAEALRLENPVAVARQWASIGFSTLHVVDLDAATGRGNNAATIRALLEIKGLTLQIGGGVRSAAQIDDLLAAGAARVVVGTRALTDRTWLAEQARRVGSRLVLAADVRDRRVLTHGWQRELGVGILELINGCRELPLAGLLVTSVQHEGLLSGTDSQLMAEVSRESPWPLIASGGIATLDHLRALAANGAASAVLGMALYTNAIDARVVAHEFNQ